jgi:NADPH:quinone reductase-like Zn-dependent oxidoreductase
MRSVAVCGSKVEELVGAKCHIETVNIDGVEIPFGLIPYTRPPEFDRTDARFRQSVLVKVRAFSCNFRDKTILLSVFRRGIENSFYPVGSEFVAEVIEVGAEVRNLRAGDRVVGNNHFEGVNVNFAGAPGGIPTNHASREFQVLHHAKLVKVPQNMPDAVAAAFSLGYQTVYAIIRKLQIAQGANVLVTSAKSNTSLFAIGALRKRNVNVYATSTSDAFAQEIKNMGVREIIRLEPVGVGGPPGLSPELRDLSQSIGGFHHVIDPFFDAHLPLAIEVMAPGGKFITCGLASQLKGLTEQPFDYKLPSVIDLFAISIMNNYQFLTSCLGLTEDLTAALDDYEAGLLDVTVDSVHQGEHVAGFFERTYSARDRFGKVVYQYAPE